MRSTRQPNDRVENATRVDPGETVTSVLRGVDTDVYAVTVPAGNRLTLQVDDTQSDVRIDDTLVDLTAVTETTRRAVQHAETTETYHVRVGDEDARFQSSGIDRYTLSTGIEPADGTDVGDAAANATAIELNQTVDDVTTVFNDTDVYALDLERGQRFNVTARSDTPSADLDVELRDPAGESLGPSEASSSGTFVAGRTGTYHVAISPAFGGGSTIERAYDLRTFGLGRVVDGDSDTGPTPLSAGDTVTQRLVGTETDTYTLQLDAGETVSVNTDWSEPYDLPARLDIEPPSDARAETVFRVGGEDIAADALVIYPSVAGTYTVHVNGTTGDVVSYSLEATAGDTGFDDPYEPDGTPELATPVEVGSTVEGMKLLQDDRDVYALELATNETVQVSAPANVTISGPAPDVADTDPEDDALRLSAGTGGTYYVTVADERIFGSGPIPYNLTVTRTGGVSVANTTVTDLDGDGRLEDLTGDGRGGLFDALTYYNNRDSAAIQNNAAMFDFDGDSRAGTLFDALALYNELS